MQHTDLRSKELAIALPKVMPPVVEDSCLANDGRGDRRRRFKRVPRWCVLFVSWTIRFRQLSPTFSAFCRMRPRGLVCV